MKDELNADDAEGDKEKDEGNFFQQLTTEVTDSERDTLANIVLVPFLSLNLITISYLNNPLMKTPAKFLILGLTVFFIIWAIELVEAAFWI